MSTFWLTAYILVWPVIAAIVMGALGVSIIRDWRAARTDGREMV
jgi:hypothetical protein